MNIQLFNKAISILLVTIFLIGCVSTKGVLKKGAQLEATGKYKAASDLYYNSIIRKPNEEEFKNALRRSGKMYIDEISIGITQDYVRGQHRKVVYDYIDGQNFIKKVAPAGVDLQLDYSTQRVYENSLDIYLNDQYELGQKLIYEKNFNESKKLFNEVSKFNPDYKDVRSYLNKATHEPPYQNGASFFTQQRYMDAYREWEKIARIDPNYKDVKDRMEQALSERYKQGNVFLMEENFTEAATALGDVLRVNAGFLDVRSLHTEAVNEPVYRRANDNLKANKCRTAYFDFDQIIGSAGSYKNTSTLRNDALSCAQFPIVVQNNSSLGGTDAQNLEYMVVQKLVNSNDPFIKVIKSDRRIPNARPTGLNNLLSNSLDRNVLRDLHDRQGIKAVLVLRITEYQKQEGKLTEVEKIGYEKRVSKAPSGEEIINYNKVKYKEYRRGNNINIGISYEMVSTLTGEVLITQNLRDNVNDNVYFANYNGNTKALYPASAIDVNTVDVRNYQSLQNLIGAKREITPMTSLVENLLNNTSNNISNTVLKFNPER
jgi:tetratricopeptide (TPR) repeat protein